MKTMSIAFFFDGKRDFFGFGFTRLMSGLRVLVNVLINPRFVSSNDAFDEYWIGFSLGNHLWR